MRMLPLKWKLMILLFLRVVLCVEEVACKDAQLSWPKPQLTAVSFPQHRWKQCGISPSLSRAPLSLSRDNGWQRAPGRGCGCAAQSSPCFRCRGGTSTLCGCCCWGGSIPMRWGSRGPARPRPGSEGAHGDGAGPAPAAGDGAVTQRCGGAGLGRLGDAARWREVGGSSRVTPGVRFLASGIPSVGAVWSFMRSHTRTGESSSSVCGVQGYCRQGYPPNL